MDLESSHDVERKKSLLYLYSFALMFAFQGWRVLSNNFGVEAFGATALEMGIVQSVREIPGLLSMFSVLVAIIFPEQKLLHFFLFLSGLGVAVTGFFPSTMGFALTTLLMSLGFHYFESYRNSLGLQWVSRDQTPQFLGRRGRLEALGGISAFIFISVISFFFKGNFKTLFMAAGMVGIVFALYGTVRYPLFQSHVKQTHRLFLKKDYTLYYALQFFAGSRRQIFVVFSTFYMVSVFHFAIYQMALLFLANQSFKLVLSPLMGRLLYRFREKPLLLIEYGALVFIFLGYGYAHSAWQLTVLYIGDHLFFSLSMALNSFFKKIAAPQDLAATFAVSYSINHIMAVMVPIVAGAVWISYGPVAIFGIGALIAGVSFITASMISGDPTLGRASIFSWQRF